MPEKSWVKGRGTESVEKSVPKSVRRLVTAEEKRAAAAKVGTGMPGVAPSVSVEPESLLADKLVKFVAESIKDSDGDFILSIKDITSKTGLSSTYARFSLKDSKIIERINEKVPAESHVEMNFDGNELAVLFDDVVETEAEEVVEITEETEETEDKVKKVVATKTKPKDYFYIDPTRKKKLTAAINACLNVWAAGPTGTGKSETYERLCEILKRESIKMSFNGESSADDLLGHYTLQGTETVWVDGALPRAMKAGAVLICEEIDAAPAECNLALQRVLENRRDGKPRSFYNPRNGETVEAKPEFVVLATANTTGGGDYTGLYAGVQVQNAAFRDRFVFEYFDYLTPAMEKKVLTMRFPNMPADMADKAVKFAGYARNAVNDGTIFTPVSTRTLLAFAQLYCVFREAKMGTKKALSEALDSSIFYKSASPSDATALKEMAQRVFGD